MGHLPVRREQRRWKSYFKNRTPGTLDTWQTAVRASQYPGCVIVRWQNSLVQRCMHMFIFHILDFWHPNESYCHFEQLNVVSVSSP